MGGPIPTLGYRSRTEAVLALQAQGLSVHQIASQIGISPNNVRCLLPQRQGDVVHNQLRQRDYWDRVRQVAIPLNDLAILAPQASKRKIRVNELWRRLIGAIAEDGLVDSVLDDADDGKARF